MKASLLATTLAIFAGLPLTAGAASPQQMSDIYNAGYLPMNEINAPLLHYVHTGKPFDTWTLLDNAGNTLPAEIAAKYRLFRSGTSAQEDKDRTGRELTDFARDLAENVRLAKGYVVRLTPQVSAYDARRKVLPLGLTMPVDKTDAGNGRYYCPGGYARVDAQLMTSCISVRKWESSHPELKEIPLADQSLADMVSERLSSGAMAFYALLQLEAPYQPARSPAMAAIPGQPGKAIAGTQPVKLVGLALVNHQSGGIVNVASTDPSVDPFQATADGPRPQGDSAPQVGSAQGPGPDGPGQARGKQGTGVTMSSQDGKPPGPRPVPGRAGSLPESGNPPWRRNGTSGTSSPGGPAGDPPADNPDPPANDEVKPPTGTPGQGPIAAGPGVAGPLGGSRIIPYAEYSAYPANRQCVADLRSKMSYAGPLESKVRKMLAQWCHITGNQAAQMFQYPVVIDEQKDIGNASISDGAEGKAHLRFGIGLLKLGAENLQNFILAHELAHFNKQHFKDRLNEKAKFALVALGGAGASWLGLKKGKIAGGLIAGGAGYLAYQQFCKLRTEYALNELEADAEGLTTLHSRGLDAGLAAKNFDKLLRNQLESLQKQYPDYRDELSCAEYVQRYVKGLFGFTPVIMHPPYRERRQHIVATLSSLGVKNPEFVMRD